MQVMRILAIVTIVLLAGWLIRRAGASLRAEIGAKRGQGGAVLTPDQMKAIVSRKLATPEQLAAMNAKEAMMLATTAMMLDAAAKKKDDSAPG